jgi:hypothetical protein
MTRRRLLALVAVFVVVRLLLVLCASDLLSEPDAAEAKLMRIGDGWIASGQAPSLERLLWHARAGANAPHGGYLFVSLLYAALVVPLKASGSYLALKLVAIGVAAIGFAAWVVVADRLGGARAAWVAAALLLAPPPAFLAGSLVPWGSHPEAMALLGLSAWALLSGRIRSVGDGAVAGLLLGLTAGVDLLVAPLVGLAALGWGWDRWRRAEAEGVRWLPQSAALLAGGAVGLGALLWLTGGATASVTETAGASPLELLSTSRAGGGDPLFGRSLAALLPLPIFGPTLAGRLLTDGQAFALDLAASLGLLGGLGVVVARARRHEALGGRVAALLVAIPATHLAVLALLAPRRPDIPPRYLLPVAPLLLVALAVALAWGWERRGLRLALLAVIALWLLPGAALQAQLIRPARIEAFPEYRPAAWLEADIGHVGYDEAPWVNRFLEARGDATEGFAFAAGAGASDHLLGEPPNRSALDPIALLDRRRAWLEVGRSPEARRAMHENLGWGLSVFAWGREGVMHAVLSHLPGGDRDAAARGLGAGLALRGSRGCEVIRDNHGPDRAAMLEGAGWIPGAGCRP